MNNILGFEAYSGFAVLYAKHVYTGMRTLSSVPALVLPQVEEMLAKINAGQVVVEWLPSA